MITKSNINQDLIFKENSNPKVRAGTVRQITPSGKYVVIEEHAGDQVYDISTLNVLEWLPGERPAGVPQNVEVVRIPVAGKPTEVGAPEPEAESQTPKDADVASPNTTGGLTG